MGGKRKRLPRGLDELMEQNEDDLPFLSTYGPAEEEGEWAASVVGEPTSEDEESDSIHDALFRHLSALLCEDGDPEPTSIDATIECDGVLRSTAAEDGSVTVTLSSDSPLPFVPSDLAAPGMVAGDLAADRLAATVTIEGWGLPARRLIARVVEHHRLGTR